MTYHNERYGNAPKGEVKLMEDFNEWSLEWAFGKAKECKIHNFANLPKDIFLCIRGLFTEHGYAPTKFMVAKEVGWKESDLKRVCGNNWKMYCVIAGLTELEGYDYI